MRNRSLLLLTMLLLAIGILTAAPVGSIKGYIRDASGAPVPNATVRVKNELTNVTQDGKSNNAGLYQFLDLAPGVYSITAETAGFRQALVKSVTVLVDQIVSVDIKLEVGHVRQQRINQRAARVPWRGVYYHPRRLINHHQVGVLIDYRQRNPLGPQGRRQWGRYAHRYGIACLQTVRRFVPGNTVHSDMPTFYKVSSIGPREVAKMSSDRAV